MGISSRLESITLLMLVIALVWPRYVLFPVGGIFVSPYNLFVWGSLGIVAMGLFAFPAFRQRMAHLISANGAVTGSYAFWVLWRLTCNLFGLSPSDSFDATLNNIVYLETPMLLFAMYIADGKSVFRLMRSVVICVIVTTCIGVYEWLNVTSFSRLVGWNLAAAGTEAARLTALTLVEQYRNGVFRAASVYNHPLVFSQLLACLAPFFLVFIKSRRLLYKFLGAILLFSILVAIYIAGARSGFVVFGVAMGAYFVFSALGKFSPARVLAFMIFLFVCWFAFGSAMLEYILDLAAGSSAAEQASSAGRDQQWAIGLEAIWNSPIFGYGDGQAVKLAGVSGRMELRSIDNQYLATILNFGMPGVVGFVVLMIAIVARMIAMASNEDARPQDSSLLRGMASAIVGLCIGFSVLAIIDNFIIVFAFAGCALGMGASDREKKRRFREDLAAKLSRSKRTTIAAAV